MALRLSLWWASLLRLLQRLWCCCCYKPSTSLLLVQTRGFIASAFPFHNDCFGCSLELGLSRRGPFCVSSHSSYLLSSSATEKSWVIFWMCGEQEQHELSCRTSCRKRETHDWGKQWSCCTKQGEMPQAYGKAREANTVCTCILPFHPAASVHSESLDAGLRPWKAAVRTWRIGRRSFRCRWMPTQPKAAEKGDEVVLMYFLF